MSEKKKVVSGFFKFSLGTWIRFIISLIQIPVITHIVEPTELGRAEMFQSLSLLSSEVLVFGMTDAFLRFYYEDDGEKRNVIFWSALFVPIFLATMFSGCVFLLRYKVNSVISGEIIGYNYMWLIFVTFISIALSFSQTIIRAENNGLIFSLLEVSKSLTYLLLSVTFLTKVSSTYKSMVIAYILSTLISFTVAISFTYHYWRRPRIYFNITKRMISYAWPLFISIIVFDLLAYTDRIMLRFLNNFESIGYYSVAYKLTSVTGVITGGYITFWRPYALKVYKETPWKVKSLFKKILDVISFSMLNLCLLIMLAKDLVFLILGRDYYSGAYVLPFLLIVPVTNTLAWTVNRGIEISKNSKIFLFSELVALVTNIAFNYTLIPIYGARGAAISTGISMIVRFHMMAKYSERAFPVGYDLKKTYIGVFIFCLVALVNTFMNTYLGVLSALAGIIAIILLYKKVFFELLHDFSKITGYVLKKVQKT